MVNIYIYIVEHYSATGKDEILPFSTIWMNIGDFETVMLGEIRQKKVSHMCNTKLKVTDVQIRKTNKQTLIGTDNSMVVTRGRRSGEGVKGKWDQIHGDRRLDFGWWAHNAI